jgi:hypothetical protein
VATTEPNRINEILQYMASLPEFDNLVSSVEASLTSGTTVFEGNNQSFIEALQVVYGALLEYTSDRETQRAPNMFVINPTDNPHFSVTMREHEPVPNMGFFTLSNWRARDVDVYSFPIDNDGNILDDGVAPPKARLAAHMGLPAYSISEIVALLLDVTGIFPNDGYSDTADCDLSFADYRKFALFVYGPGKDLNGVEGIDWDRMRAAGIRSMVTCILDPIITIVIGMKASALPCIGQILLAHGELLWNGFVAASQQSPQTFVSSLPSVVLSAVAAIGIAPCVPAALAKILGGLVQNVAKVLALWDAVMAVPDLSEAIYAWWDTPAKIQYTITEKFPPMAKAKAEFTTAQVGQQIFFQDNGSYDPDGGNLVKWEWDWENDGTYYDVNGDLYHSWDTPGTYYVQYRVTDDEGETDTLDEPFEITITGSQTHIIGSVKAEDIPIGAENLTATLVAIRLDYGSTVPVSIQLSSYCPLVDDGSGGRTFNLELPEILPLDAFSVDAAGGSNSANVTIGIFEDDNLNCEWDNGEEFVIGSCNDFERFNNVGTSFYIDNQIKAPPYFSVSLTYAKEALIVPDPDGFTWPAGWSLMIISALDFPPVPAFVNNFGRIRVVCY